MNDDPPPNLTKHLKTIFAEGALSEAATCKDCLQVRQVGARVVGARAGFLIKLNKINILNEFLTSCKFMQKNSTIMLISGYVNRRRLFLRQPVPHLPLAVRTARAQLSPERIAPPHRPGKRFPATGTEPVGRSGPGALGAQSATCAASRPTRKARFTAELVSLTRKTLGIEPMLREALRPLVPDLQAAWIYGSVAKQTDTAQSDIDVMLVGKNLLLGKIAGIAGAAGSTTGAKDQPDLLHARRVRAPPRRARFVRQSRSGAAQPFRLIGDAR